METSTVLLVGAGVVVAVLLSRNRAPASTPSIAMHPQPPTSGMTAGLSTGAGGLSAFLALPDPSNLPLGTKSPDGKYQVVQSRQEGSVPHWEPIITSGSLGGLL